MEATGYGICLNTNRFLQQSLLNSLEKTGANITSLKSGPKGAWPALFCGTEFYAGYFSGCDGGSVAEGKAQPWPAALWSQLEWLFLMIIKEIMDMESKSWINTESNQQ